MEMHSSDDAIPPTLDVEYHPLEKLSDEQLKELNDEVRNLCDGVSGKYVPTPSKKQILQDLLLSLRRYKNSVRWKFFHILRKNKGVLGLNDPPKDDEDPTNPDPDDNPLMANKKDEGGLNTGLKPQYRNFDGAPEADKATEAFLEGIEAAILAQHDKLDENRMHIQTPTIGKQIKHLLQKIRDKDVVVVPTDKTNSFQVVHTQQYVKWMENQLDKVATRTTKKKLGEVSDDALWLLVNNKDDLSANEFNYILEMINSHALESVAKTLQ